MSVNNIRDRLNEVLKDVGLKQFIECPCGGRMYDWHSHASNCIIINKRGVDYAERKTNGDSAHDFKRRVSFRKLRGTIRKNRRRDFRMHESL